MHIVMKEAIATTTTANGGFLHYLSPGALDGFAVGALLSGLILLIMVPRLMRRAQPKGMFRDYFATPADGGQFAGALAAAQERAAAASADDMGDVDTDAYELDGLTDAVEKDAVSDDTIDADGAPGKAIGADAPPTDPVQADTGSEDDLSRAGSDNGAHRSKHRMSARPAMSAWRIEVRRGRPRHAARPTALGTPVTGQVASVRD
jgi:hypothetical protein